MTDVVWVALISVAGTLAATITTQWLTAKAANRQAARLEWQQQQSWQRDDAKARREQQQQDLRQLWLYALEAQKQVLGTLDRPAGSASKHPTFGPAAHCYACALIGIPDLRASAKDFYRACAEIDVALSITPIPAQAHDRAVHQFGNALKELERAVLEAADKVAAL